MGKYISNAPDGNGTNQNGNDLVLVGGRGTGSGIGGAIKMRTSPRGGAGAQINAPITRKYIVSQRRDIVDNVATGIFEVSLGSNEMTGGSFSYVIHCTDGTDYQCHSGFVTFAAVSKASVITAVINESAQLESNALSAGTLTDAWTIVAGTGKVTITLQSNTSLTPTSMYVFYQIRQDSPTGIVTPL